MACCWPRPWHDMLAKVGHGMLLAKAVAWHAAGQGRGMTCLPRPGHGMLLAKAVAWHAAGQGCGMACCWPRTRHHAAGRGFGMACCWPRPWHGMLAKVEHGMLPAKAVAWHAAGQGVGMACCWPRPWHGMLLAKALACHAAGQGCGMPCWPRSTYHRHHRGPPLDTSRAWLCSFNATSQAMACAKRPPRHRRGLWHGHAGQP